MVSQVYEEFEVFCKTNLQIQHGLLLMVQKLLKLFMLVIFIQIHFIRKAQKLLVINHFIVEKMLDNFQMMSIKLDIGEVLRTLEQFVQFFNTDVIDPNKKTYLFWTRNSVQHDVTKQDREYNIQNSRRITEIFTKADLGIPTFHKLEIMKHSQLINTTI